MADTPQHDPQLINMLTHAIVSSLGQNGGQMPQAPTAPNPVGLRPLQAAAGAMNPQFIPYFQQQANAPGQNQYEQQRAQFQAALEGRQHAINAGVALEGQSSREDIAGIRARQDASDAAALNNHRQIMEELQRQRDAAAATKVSTPAPVKPPKTATDKNGQQIEFDPQTGKWKPSLTTSDNTILKAPTPADQQLVRSGAVLHLRLDQARKLIEGGGDRLQRSFERGAAHDPTGILSGSDFAANASTYQSYINEIGSLTRSLYGAQGIRSYEEILRLINAMPPWNAGHARIKQQFDALDKAIGAAESELRSVRPDLYQTTGNQPAAAAKPTSSLDNEFDAWSTANATKR